MAGRARILIPEYREPRALLQNLLAPVGEIFGEKEKPYPEAEFARALAGADALVVTSREKVTEGALRESGRLKLIAKMGVGVENVDIPSATRRGIPVVNTPGANAISVGEHALSLHLAAARRVPQSQAHLRRGGWRERSSNPPELTGSTFGIVGLGNAGRALARLLRGFEVRLLACDPAVSPERAREVGAELVELERLLEESDFVSLHCTLTPETHHLMNAERLARMKPTAILVNCSRGPVVDEEALCEALRGGRLRAAGLDVFEREPPSAENPLLALDNVVCTPHLGGSSARARERVYRTTGENVARVLRGERPLGECLLNPEVF